MNNNKQKILKGLLATAMITGSANAMAASTSWVYTTNGGAANWGAAANLDIQGGAILPQTVATVSDAISGTSAFPQSLLAAIAVPGTNVSDAAGPPPNVQVTAVGDTISLSLGNDFTFDGASAVVQNITTTAPVTATVSQNVAVNGNVTGADIATLKFGAGQTVTFNNTGAGVDFSKLAIDFNGQSGRAKFNSSGVNNTHLVISGNIDNSAGGSFGTLQAAGNLLEFQGQIGGTNPLAQITVLTGKNTFFNGSKIQATNVVLGGSTANATFNTNASDVTITADISTYGGGVGNVNFIAGNAAAAAGHNIAITTTQGIGTSSSGVTSITNITATGGNGSDTAAFNGGYVNIPLGGAAGVSTAGSFTAHAGAGGASGVGGSVNVAGTVNASNMTISGGNAGLQNGGIVTIGGNTTLVGGAASTIAGGVGGGAVGAVAGAVGGGVTTAGITTAALGLTITGGLGGNASVAAIGGNAGGVSVGALNIANGLTIQGGAGGASSGVNVGGNGGGIEFGGNITAALGDITITDGAKNDAAAASLLNFGANGISATAGQVVINAAPTLNGGISAGTNVNLTAHANGAMTLGGAVQAGTNINITATANPITITGKATAGTSIVVADATKLVTLNTINSPALSVGTGAAGVLLNKGFTAALNFTADGLVTLADGQTIGAVDNTSGAANYGTLNLQGDATMTGGTGITSPLKLITIAGDTKTVNTGSDIHAQTINFTHANGSTLKFNTAPSTIYGNIGTSNPGKGIIDVTTQNGNVVGNIGTSNASLSAINIGAVAAAKTFTVGSTAGGASAYVNTIGLSNAASTLAFNSDTQIFGAIDNITGANTGGIINNNGHSVTVSGLIGKTNTLNQLNINGGSFTTGAGASIDTVTFVANGALNLGANLNIANPVNAKAAGGTIMANGANATITGAAVDATGQTITLGAGGATTLTLANGVNPATTNIAIADTGTVDFGANDITVAAGGTINFNSTGIINLEAGQNITSPVTATKASEGTIKIADGNSSLAAVTNISSISYAGTALSTLTLTDNVVSNLVFTADGTIALGANKNITGNITGGGSVSVANGNSTIKGNISNAGGLTYAGAGGVNALTLNGGVSTPLTFTADGIINLTAGNNITGSITGVAGGSGTINAPGTRTFSGAITNLAELNLQTNNSVFTFNTADVLAKAVNVADGSEIVVGVANVSFGEVIGKDTTITLGSNTATLTNGATLTGAVTINLTAAGPGPAGCGMMNVTGGDLDSSAVTGTTINVTNAGVTMPNAQFQVIALTGAATHTASPAGVNVIDTAPSIIKWSYNDTNGVLTASVDAPKVAALVVESEGDISLFNPTNTGAALQEEVLISSIPDPVERIEAEQQVQPVTTTAAAISQVTTQVAQVVISTIGSRMNDITGGMTSVMPTSIGTPDIGGPQIQPTTSSPSSSPSGTTNVEGVNSGDEAISVPVGLWSVGFGGTGIQRPLQGASGYKSKMYGAALGMDAKFNENLLAGIALTYADIDVLHRNAKKGDSTQAPTLVASLYGVYDFGNNWFTRGIASYSKSRITDKEKRPVTRNTVTGAIGYSVAEGVYNSNSFTAELGGGYRFALNDSVSMTPSAALSYSYFNDGGYTETGAGNANKQINKKTYNQFAGVLGANIVTSQLVGGNVITPELHAYVRQNLSGKNPTVVSKFVGSAEAFSSKYKPAKTSYTLGGSVTIRSGITDFGVGYDTQLSKKYIGQQGTLKVRVNL